MAAAADAAPTIGTEFEVARGPVTSLPGIDSLVACTSASSCIVVWRRESGAHMVATRIGVTGSLDPVPIELSTVGVPVSLVAKGSDYVLMYDEYTALGVKRRAKHLSGVMLLPLGPVIDLPAGSAIHGLGDRVAVLSPEGSGSGSGFDLAYLGDTGLEKVQLNAGAACDWSCIDHAGVARGGGYVAVAWYGKLRRFDENTLSPIDAVPVATNTLDANIPQLGFDGANFVLVWGVGPSRAIRLARVRATDGSLLDPDDTFNAIPGSHVVQAKALYSAYGEYPRRTRVASPAPGEVVVYATYDDSPSSSTYRFGSYLTRVVTSGATPKADATIFLGNGAVTKDGYGSLPPTENLAGFGWAGDHGVFAIGARPTWTTPSSVNARSLTRLAVGPISVGDSFAVSTGCSSLTEPVVASDGTDFLVAWPQGGALVGRRYRGYDGLALDSTPRVLHSPFPGSSPVLRSTNYGYALSWKDGSALYLKALDKTGTELWSRSHYDFAVGFDLGCDGERCALLYSRDEGYSGSCKYVRALRYGPAGEKLDATPTTLVGCTSYGINSVVVAGNPGRAPSFRTFMTAWHGASYFSTTSSARLRAEKGVVLSNPFSVDSEVALLLASDGERFLLATRKSETLQLRGIDDVDGTPFPTATAIEAIDKPTGYRGTPSISFDGSSYLLAYRPYANQVKGRYLPKDLTSAGSVFDIATDTFDGYGERPAYAASNAYGRSLVTFERGFEPTTAPGGRIVAAFVDSELGPGTPPPPPPLDAGPDADEDSGATDASVDDGAVDATLDTSLPDTTVDSEPVDSASVDSEPVDSEPVDSAPIDSEPVDSEPPAPDADGGATDAVAPDDVALEASTDAFDDAASAEDSATDTTVHGDSAPSTSDAGADDASVDVDATAAGDAAGCGCHVGQTSRSTTAMGVLVAVASIAVRRRRRTVMRP